MSIKFCKCHIHMQISTDRFILYNGNLSLPDNLHTAVIKKIEKIKVSKKVPVMNVKTMK